MNRRMFIKRAIKLGAGASAVAALYPLFEAKHCRVVRYSARVPWLAPPFVGTTIAFLSDIHHGPFVPLDYIQRVVTLANSLRPDIVVLGGDYVYSHARYIAPGIAELAALRAPLGRFAVLGNHDNRDGRSKTKEALAEAGLTELTNTGVWIKRGAARVRMCGIGDLWTDRQNPVAAIGAATDRDAVIMLSHNPDYAELLEDERVGLMLSGHTHGGQVVVPGFGAPIVPSAFGQKYLHGLVEGPVCQVFVTRGVGTVSPPVRFHCPPEVALLTLNSLT
jgi:predicted MPP superfamily phosphohydrolase